jgi:hypothetical protein
MFNMMNCKAAPTSILTGLKLSNDDKGYKVDSNLYKQLLGSLMHLTVTRSYIIFLVSLVSRFMESPKVSHWEGGKGILKYVSGTRNYGIFYSRSSDFNLIRYIDSDYVGKVNDMNRTSGYVFHFGLGVVSKASKKQTSFTISSVEAEYVAAT